MTLETLNSVSPTDGYTNHRSTSGGYVDRRTMQRGGSGSRRNHNSRTSQNGHNSRYNNNGFHGGGGGSSDGYDNSESSAQNFWPPRDWKSFTEIKFKVSSVHTNADITDLRNAFAAYGNVYKMQIDTRETDNGEVATGVVYVIFKPVPTIPFWKKEVRFHGKLLQVDYQRSDHGSDTFTDQTDGKRKLKFHSFQAESLEMGVYLNPETFVSEIKYTDLVKFIINYQKRNITVEFGVQVAQQIHVFKLEINFKDIEGEIHAGLDASQQRSRGSITIANKFPAKYWLLDKRLQSKDKFNWCLDDSWKRKAEIRILKKSEEEKKIPLQPHMPDNSDQLGKWVVYRITFDLDQLGKTSGEGLKCFKEMIEKAGEYNLASKPANINNRPLNIINGANLCKYVEPPMLDFNVLYMVESNISFNYLHDYNLNEDFFSLLSRLPTQAANNILETIYSKKKRIYDPLSYLRLEIVKLNNVEMKPKHVPSYCVMMRKVVVTPTTMYILTPTMETSNRVIRHFRDKKDNFLRVHFVDEASNKVSSSNGTHNYALYNRIFNVLYNGIKIGDRHYEFLAFSSSQLRDHSCWFFAPTHDLTADDIRNWMGDFSTNKTVAKYAARMGQCFSSTRAIQRLPVDDIKEIPDVIRNQFTFSDGIGKISFSLLRKIAEKLELKATPSTIQFRLAGYKGVLCQSPFLRDSQIQVRPSQHKFESTHYILEVIRCSSFIPAYLNRQAITLLSVLGVPDNVFVELKNTQISDLDKMLKNENTAVNVLQQNIDEHGISKSLADLVKAGFFQKRDRYLINLISLFRIMMLRDLKKKAKIRVDKGAFLLGVLDETETLKENQIYCCVSDPLNPSNRKVITGTCVVWRNPCFHPGDIRVVTAVDNKRLCHLVDVVVFPAVGYRDIPSACSGGDLDGDDFTILYDERLIPLKKNLEPMNYEAPKPVIVEHVTMEHIKKFFVNYILSDQLGMIANAHLAKADSFEAGAFHGQCIRLAQLHSEAVDFPKTGKPAIFPPGLRAHKFPDFMEKGDKSTYQSKKVLGELYRSIEIVEFEPETRLNFDSRLYVEGYKTYLEDARMLKRAYDADIKGLMNQFGIATEFEVTSGYIVNAITKVDRKKPRDVAKSVMDAINPIKRHYRKLFEEEFYSEGTNIVLPEARSRMESKAYAWYYVTYHPSELGDDPSENMISFPWMLHDILCEIAIRNNNKANNIRTTRDYQKPIWAIRQNGESDDGMKKKLTVRNNNFNSDYANCNQYPLNDFVDENDDGMGRLRKQLSMQKDNNFNTDYANYNQYTFNDFTDENDDGMDRLKKKLSNNFNPDHANYNQYENNDNMYRRRAA